MEDISKLSIVSITSAVTLNYNGIVSELKDLGYVIEFIDIKGARVKFQTAPDLTQAHETQITDVISKIAVVTVT